MKLDVRRPESWDKTCDLYRRSLGFTDADPQSVQVFLTIDQALREVCSELASIYVHRKTVFFEKDLGPEFDETAVWFSKNEYQVKSLSRAQLTGDASPLGAGAIDSGASVVATVSAVKNSSEVETPVADPHAWIEASAKDLLLVVSKFDDAVTGEVLESSVLEPRFKDKRFFRLRISHSMHAFQKLPPPNAYEIWILSLGENSAGEPRVVAVSGERGRTRPSIASILPWSESDSSDLAPDSAALAQTDFSSEQSSEAFTKRMKLIEEFEAKVAKLLPGARTYFSLPHVQGRQRLPHAAVFYFEDLDGSAFADLLIEKIAALPESVVKSTNPVNAPMNMKPHELVSATSLCRWQSPRLFSHLNRQGLSQNQLRGLVLLDPDLLSINGLDAVLSATLAEIRQLQG